MLLLLLGLLAAEPERAPASDIIVFGQRMKRIRVVTRHDKTGAQRCIVRRSSGDAALDEAVCTATLACAQTETRVEGMTACMTGRLDAVRDRFTGGSKTSG